MTSSELEKEYVHNVYTRLATYQQKSENRSSCPRQWPNIKKFVDQLEHGSLIIDIGCGEAKYSSSTCTVFGVDTCSDVLLNSKQKANVQLILGDALCLPFRDESVDAVLLVSVLHHISTAQRRLAVLADAIRCLRYGGRMIICVWAFEQPNAQFPSQDVLVPWKMNEQVINGRLPPVRFHLDSTKEQRIIEASIPIHINRESMCSPSWFNSLINKFQSLNSGIPFLNKQSSTSLPPSVPNVFPTSTRNSILSGIKRWSPMLSRRLASLLVTVEEQLADEMTEKIMQEALSETMATSREVSFYRYYHVFRKGEMENLLSSIPDVRIIQSNYEHANWCITIEKVQESIRP